MSNYYSMQLQSSGNYANPAFFYVTVVGTGATYDGAAVTIYPSSTQATWFSYQSQSLQFNSPAGRLGAGITVVTSESFVAGTLGASPAINVATTLTIYGAGGHQLGSVTLPAGQDSIAFKFDVSGGMSAEEATKQMQSFAAKPE